MSPDTNLLPVTDESRRDQTPLVSICCAAYNHDSFIGEAIEGFLMQRTCFPVEILIHDDASTDRTAAIVRNYEARYPWLIRTIYQSENQYSKNVHVAHLNYARARGSYIALCEGDDAWTDPLKLEKQIGLMQKHPNCQISFHCAPRIDYARNGQRKMIGLYGNTNRVVPTEEVIVKKFGTIPTASCVLNTEAVRRFTAFSCARPYLTLGDIYMQIISSLNGGALYLNEPMSLYRARTEGSWTWRAEYNPAFRVRHARAVARSFVELDALTDHRFSEAFRQATRKYVNGVIRSRDIDAGEKARLYSEHRAVLRTTDRLAYLLRSLLPTRRKSENTGTGQ
jgi:glycosyltransferase involved in cell wall biosynthesis